MRLSIPVFLFLFLSGCGTFRTGGGYHKDSYVYRGLGSYKPPSEYSKGIDSGDNTVEELLARERLNNRGHYTPRTSFRLEWPVEFVRINRGFNPPSDPRHAGVDLGGRRGMPILSAHEGIVVYAGNEFRGYGNLVLVEYNRTWATLYAHMDEISVKEGMILQPGDLIGSMGDTGKVTGVHLHFELMKNRTPIDPLPLFSPPNRLSTKNKTPKGRRAASR